MPPSGGVAGVMLLALIPPTGTYHGFLTWSEMGAWQSGLVQGRRETSPQIKEKVAELTAGSSTPTGRIIALAGFMQKEIRYVGIWLGIGGWQPHSAQEVFAHRYGDCKDKATLLSTMLKEVGIDSYYVLIDSERGNITPATAAHLGLFDHMILAIRLPEGASDPGFVATIQHPKLGKLLIFDPTDELTPIGALHGELQASYALLVTPDGGELLQMPQQTTTTSGTTRTGKLSLDATGNLKGDVREQRAGDAAWWQRAELRFVDKTSDQIKPLENTMSRSLASFVITKASINNLKQNLLPLEWKWSFLAQNYAKRAGDLWLVRPRVLGVNAWGVLETKEPRMYPVEFRGPEHDSDTFDIELPPGYEVDELPPPMDVEYSFGNYHSKTVAEGNVLHYTRTYEIKQLSVPLNQTEDLKRFYRMIASDERNTAVLKPVGHPTETPTSTSGKSD
jgi:Transglutaminase-like superfamily